MQRNGRFADAYTVSAGAVFADPPSDGDLAYELSGRLRDRRVRGGRIGLDGVCASNETFTAKRSGR